MILSLASMSLQSNIALSDFSRLALDTKTTRLILLLFQPFDPSCLTWGQQKLETVPETLLLVLTLTQLRGRGAGGGGSV